MLTAKQQKIIEAIQAGAQTYQEIEDLTKLKHGTVANNLSKLYAMYRVTGLESLRQFLSRSHSERHVRVDDALPPERAANLLVQVLGVTYCALLASALLNELKN